MSWKPSWKSGAVIGSIITLSLIGGLLKFEPQLIGSILHVDSVTFGSKNINQIPGPNTDAATAFEILRKGVEKAVAERDVAYADRDKALNELASLKGQTATERDVLAKLKAEKGALEDAYRERDDAKRHDRSPQS